MGVAGRMLEVLPDEAHWAKGAYFLEGVNDGPDQVCLMGALGKAKHGNPLYYVFRVDRFSDPHVIALLKIIREQFPDREFDVPRFNDAIETSYADVRMVLEKMAAEEG